MNGRRRVAAAAALVMGAALPALGAPPPPHGPHPRIALSPAVLTALKGKAAADAVAAAADMCKTAPVARGAASGSQGFDWAAAASACALAWQVTGKPAYAARGVTLWRALLEDIGEI